MAADSAITMYRSGTVVQVDRQYWQKLLEVASIVAAVSYWGMVGYVTTERFDEWLKRAIARGSYSDLASFADFLTEALNRAASDKLIRNKAPAGIHVAGYAPWPDGIRRPLFYHIHNGHGHVELHEEWSSEGPHRRLVSVYPKWVMEPRKEFRKYQDFPNASKTIDANLAALRRGYLTKNGDYVYYAVVWDAMQRSFAYLNHIPGFSIPRDPASLASWKGYMHEALETTIRVFKASNQSKTVGGRVSSLAIGPAGYLR